MRIVFDCRYIRKDVHDGISRFSLRLLQELSELLLHSEDELIALVSEDYQPQIIGDIPHFFINSPTSIRERRAALHINPIKPDVVFSPMQTIGSRGKKYPLVLTIHDLIYYTHPTPPRQFNVFVRILWRLYHMSWWPQKYLLKQADGVIAVSETTKSLIEKMELTQKTVCVVHNAADGLSPAHSIAAADNRRKELIYMGSFMPYKNVETLILAMNELPEYTLHLLSPIEQKIQIKLSLGIKNNNVIFHNGVSDEEYSDLLSQATALVSASRNEGFGIPIVEAMSIGTPVVVSDIPIFHEIGGQAALYASPDSPKEFVQHVRQLEDTELWTHHSQECVRQAARFNWHHSAQELLIALQTVAGKK